MNWYCRSGKATYKTWYAAERRLKYENRILGYRGGEVYKCKFCGWFHITRESTKKKIKKMGINAWKNRNAKLNNNKIKGVRHVKGLSE